MLIYMNAVNRNNDSDYKRDIVEGKLQGQVGVLIKELWRERVYKYYEKHYPKLR